MIATNPDVDTVLTIPDRWTPGSLFAVARTLRARRFDAVFVPERTPLPGILALLAGIPVRAGLNSRGRGFAYTHPADVPSTVIHEADLYLLLAQHVGVSVGERRPHFHPTAADRERAWQIIEAFADRRPIVVIHPGGGQNPGMTLATKRWQPERWAAVADVLHDRHHVNILIVGSADELSVAESVRTAMRTPATVIARQWEWGVLAALLERAWLFLGHDTGMMHLAHAVGTRVVAVFGPSDPQVYGPYSPHTRAVWRPTLESPCFYDGIAPSQCPCAGQCMRNVETRDVLAAIDAVMKAD